MMVGLQPDRGAIASLLIAALYLAPVLFRGASWKFNLRMLALCTGSALIISLAAFLALFQSNIIGVKLGGEENREQAYYYVTQFSLGPAETLTYLVPGLFGWHTSNMDGPYWGWIGEWPTWPKNHQGSRNLNLAISTTGTVATLVALLGAVLLLPGRLGQWLSPVGMSPRQRFYGQVFLVLGTVALILSWGWHTPFYRSLFTLPLMDKWRNPLKWLEMTNFALVVLSAFGAEQLIASLAAETKQVVRVRRRLTWFLGGAMVMLLLGMVASYPLAIVLVIRLRDADFTAEQIGNVLNTLHLSLDWWR